MNTAEEYQREHHRSVDHRLIGIVAETLADARDAGMDDAALSVLLADRVWDWLGEGDAPAIPLPWLKPSPDELTRQGLDAFTGAQLWLCPVAGCGRLIHEAHRDEHARAHFPS